MHATMLASYRRQHGQDVTDEMVNALRQMLVHATQRNEKQDDYGCTPGGAGTNAYAAGAKAALEAMFDWAGVFSKAKLQGAASRTATSDGCALNLTLLAENDSGGRVKTHQRKRAKEERGEPEAEPAAPPPLPVAEGDVERIVVGGDFGRSGEMRAPRVRLAADQELHTGMAATAVPPFVQQLFVDEALRRKTDASQVTSIMVRACRTTAADTLAATATRAGCG